MKVTKMKPFGVRVTDYNINCPDDSAQLKQLVSTEGVVILPRDAAAKGCPPTYTKSSMAQIGLLFGKPMTSHDVDTFREGSIVSQIVTGGSHTDGPDSYHFHSDLSYWKEPSSIVLLSCEVRPDGDVGHTHFLNANIMYNSLSEESKEFLDTHRFVHSLHHAYGIGGRKDVPVNTTEIQTNHPGLIRHPRTGLPIPYISRSSVLAVEGMTKEESAPILNKIIDEMYDNEYMYDHDWTVGDIVIWDNFGTQHRVMNDYTELRIMRKVALIGDHPPPTKYERPPTTTVEAKNVTPLIEKEKPIV